MYIIDTFTGLASEAPSLALVVATVIPVDVVSIKCLLPSGPNPFPLPPP